MSVELPGEVAWFLNLIGVPWPNVDEDQVRVFAQHVRTFAENIDGTHQAASSTIRQMSAAYQGSSYEQLVASWARMSNDHMRELVDACHTVATALDVAAVTAATSAPGSSRWASSSAVHEVRPGFSPELAHFSAQAGWRC